MLLVVHKSHPPRRVWPTVNPNSHRSERENVIIRADLPGFLVVGIEVRTTNAKEATADAAIPRQWQKFFQERILGKIPNKVGANIYALYSG